MEWVAAVSINKRDEVPVALYEILAVTLECSFNVDIEVGMATNCGLIVEDC